MKLFYPLILFTSFCACTSDSKNNSGKKYVSAKKELSFEQKSYNLDSLEAGKHLRDSIKNLPKINNELLKSIIPKLNDNSIDRSLLFDKNQTFYRLFDKITIGDKTGLVIVRITDYNGPSGKIYLVIMDKNAKIIVAADLAEYYDEAGSQTFLRSIRTSENEFSQIINNSDIEQSDKPDSLGVNEVLGTLESKTTRKLQFTKDHFIITAKKESHHLKKVD